MKQPREVWRSCTRDIREDQYTGGSGSSSSRELFSLVKSAICVRIRGHR